MKLSDRNLDYTKNFGFFLYVTFFRFSASPVNSNILSEFLTTRKIWDRFSFFPHFSEKKTASFRYVKPGCSRWNLIISFFFVISSHTRGFEDDTGWRSAEWAIIRVRPGSKSENIFFWKTAKKTSKFDYVELSLWNGTQKNRLKKRFWI